MIFEVNQDRPTFFEFLFACEGELGIEADLWEYFQSPLETRPNWPLDHFCGYLELLHRIDRHAIDGTLDQFRDEIRRRESMDLTASEAEKRYKVEGPWLKEWVNTYRILNGPENDSKRKVVQVAERSLGFKRPVEGQRVSLRSFEMHPRTEMEILEVFPRYKRGRGGEKLRVPWGSEAWNKPMDEMRRLVLGQGWSRKRAALKIAEDDERQRHSDYHNDILQRFRSKMSIR